jgi:hypothetical protein
MRLKQDLESHENGVILLALNRFEIIAPLGLMSCLARCAVVVSHNEDLFWNYGKILARTFHSSQGVFLSRIWTLYVESWTVRLAEQADPDLEFSP